MWTLALAPCSAMTKKEVELPHHFAEAVLSIACSRTLNRDRGHERFEWEQSSSAILVLAQGAVKVSHFPFFGMAARALAARIDFWCPQLSKNFH